MVNKDSTVAIELREQPVLTGTSQKILQVDQINKSSEIF